MTKTLAVILLAAGGSFLYGQSTYSNIVGVVRDLSGAITIGASITAKEEDTGAVARTSSNSEGLFELPNLKPGRYVLTASKAGFADSNGIEVILESRRTIRTNLDLRLPTARESVTITATGEPIDTEDGTVADSKSFAQINALPLNFRGTGTNPTVAISSAPGVQGTGGNNTSLGGGLPTLVEYSIDGISTVNVVGNGPLVGIYPSPEILAEFRVTSAQAPAEFGQMGDVSVITKGGTNQLHGSLFWYHQNAALDAKPYGAPVKPAKIYNTFGASLGGPVVVPGAYRGRNRTFFFVDYEGNRQPGTALRQASVPTADMWGGNLAGVPGPVVDHARFPGNIIPKTQINSVARNLAAYYPLPNFDSGSTLNNYRVLIPNESDVNGYDVRLDHTISQKQQVFVRWTWRGIQSSSGVFRLLPPDQVEQRNRNLVVSHNFTLQSNLVNEIRTGWSRWNSQNTFPIRATDAVASLGIQGLNLSGIGNGGGFPFFDFSDGTGFTYIYHGREGTNVSRNWQVTDNLTWIKRAHTLKFGVDVRRLGYEGTLHLGNNDELGYFQFNQAAFSGNAFADLLLGLPASSEVGVVGPNVDQRTVHTHAYAQDQWRVSRRLTLSLGIGWQVHPPMTEESGNITNFDQATGSVIIPDQTLAPSPSFLASINACPGTTSAFPCTKIVTASQAGLGEGLRKTEYGNWTPRLGFAYQPFRGERTVLRGGFGIYTNTVLGSVANALTGVHTSDVRTYQNFQGSGLPPAFSFPQAYPGQFSLASPGNASFNVATNTSYKDPRSYQWNFTVEQMLDRWRSVRLSYIGAQSVGLTEQVDLNQVPASSVPYSRGRTPYPVWTSVYSLENIGFANYQSLQTEFSQRLQHGASLQASYTLAKDIGNAQGPTGGFGFPNPSMFTGEYSTRVPTDRFNGRLDRGELAGSRRHRFQLTGIVPVPVGKSRLIGGRIHGLPEALIGGWDLSTVTLIESGPFQTPIISGALDQSNTNVLARGGTARPDRISDGNLTDQATGKFYDITAFVPAPAGSGRFGNSGVGILRGPHMVAIAAGLSKTVSLTERGRLRLEGSFINLPNHPNFQAPAVNVSIPSSFGKLTSVQSSENSGNRSGQVSARLEF
jgi:hypothetical protein